VRSSFSCAETVVSAMASAKPRTAKVIARFMGFSLPCEYFCGLIKLLVTRNHINGFAFLPRDADCDAVLKRQPPSVCVFKPCWHWTLDLQPP
jgi:hypothetical protein